MNEIKSKKLSIHIDELAGSDERMARYLAALSEYRHLARKFAADLEAYGEADRGAVKQASKALAEIEQDPDFVRDRMRPVREISDEYGVSLSQIRNACNGHGTWAGQVECEKRYGKLWYVDPIDVEYLLDEEDD